MKELEKMDLLRKKQNGYMVKIEEILFSESSPFKNGIYKLFYLSQFGESLEIYVFYKNDKILLNNLQNGTTENIKAFIKIQMIAIMANIIRGRAYSLVKLPP